MQPRLSAAVCHDDVCHPFLPPPHESTVRRSSTGSDFRARLITAGIIWLRAPVWKIQFLQLSFRTFWCRRETRSACLLAGWLWGWSGGLFGRWNGRGGDRQIGGWWRRLKKAGRRSAPRGNWSEEGKGRGGGRRREKGLSRLLKSGIKGVAGRLDSSRLAWQLTHVISVIRNLVVGGTRLLCKILRAL